MLTFGVSDRLKVLCDLLDLVYLVFMYLLAQLGISEEASKERKTSPSYNCHGKD